MVAKYTIASTLGNNLYTTLFYLNPSHLAVSTALGLEWSPLTLNLTKRQIISNGKPFDGRHQPDTGYGVNRLIVNERESCICGNSSPHAYTVLKPYNKMTSTSPAAKYTAMYQHLLYYSYSNT